MTITSAESESCGCAPESAAYPQPWYDRIVAENGEHFLDGSSGNKLSRLPGEGTKSRAVSKVELLRKY